MGNKECKECGNPITRKGAVFCGRECYHKSRRKHNGWKLRDDGAVDVILTRGQFTVIDADDLDLILHYGGWIAQRSRGSWRAARCPRVGESNPIYLMHRLIMSALEHEEVDHINHDTLDNRKANLRLCSHQENLCNSLARGQSQYRGVYPTMWGTWCASVTTNGERFYIGSFKSEVQAARAYNEVAKDKHGEFANLNDV